MTEHDERRRRFYWVSVYLVAPHHLAALVPSDRFMTTFCGRYRSDEWGRVSTMSAPPDGLRCMECLHVALQRGIDLGAKEEPEPEPEITSTSGPMQFYVYHNAAEPLRRLDEPPESRIADIDLPHPADDPHWRVEQSCRRLEAQRVRRRQRR